MTSQGKQELKEKLAKWVGWHEEKYEITRGAFALVLLAPNEELSEGHIGYIPEHTPNLPDSFDACSEWFMPKLRSDENYVDINLRDFHPEMGDPYLFTIRMAFGYPVIRAWQGGAETPALAFCLAVEKLIDGGTKNANK